MAVTIEKVIGFVNRVISGIILLLFLLLRVTVAFRIARLSPLVIV